MYIGGETMSNLIRDIIAIGDEKVETALHSVVSDDKKSQEVVTSDDSRIKRDWSWYTL